MPRKLAWYKAPKVKIYFVSFVLVYLPPRLDCELSEGRKDVSLFAAEFIMSLDSSVKNNKLAFYFNVNRDAREPSCSPERRGRNMDSGKYS